MPKDETRVAHSVTLGRNLVCRWFTLCLAAALSPAAAWAAGDLDLEPDEKTDEEDAAALLGEEVKQDLDLLRVTHLSLLSGWDQVQRPAPAAGDTNATSRPSLAT